MLPQQKSKGKRGKKATQPPPPSMRIATASSSNSTTTERKNFNPKALEFIPGSGSHGPLWFGPSCLPANMVVSVGMPAPKGVAAMWNLDHSYTEESLRADLLEVDFEPEQIISCGANKGAFVLVFAKTYEAKALATALDRIDPEEKVVQSCGNSEAFHEPVRVIASEDELAPPCVRKAMWKIKQALPISAYQ